MINFCTNVRDKRENRPIGLKIHTAWYRSCKILLESQRILDYYHQLHISTIMIRHDHDNNDDNDDDDDDNDNNDDDNDDNTIHLSEIHNLSPFSLSSSS